MGADGWDGRKRPINWKLAGGRKCRQMSTNCVKDVSFGADLARPPGGTCNTRIPFFKNKNSIKDGATVYKEINQWADGPVGDLRRPGYEMKNKLLPWQREVGPMLSESKEETLNRVLKIFPFVLPPPMEGNWKVSTLRPCSPRKVVWWRKKKCNFTACWFAYFLFYGGRDERIFRLNLFF